VIAAYAVCGAGVVLGQRLARYGAVPDSALWPPVPRLWKSGRPRFFSGEVFALVIAFSAASFFLLLTGRPFMSIVCCLGLAALLAILNRAKEKSLREPVVLADAWLLPQVFACPGMYFPFLPVRKIALGAVFTAALLALLFFAESPLPALRSPGALLGLAAAAFIPALGIALMRRGRWRGMAGSLLFLCPVGESAAADADANGALTSALMHPVWAGATGADNMFADWRARPEASRWPENFEAMLREADASPPAGMPHVVLVQAESFCDVRETFKDRLSEAQREALRDFLPGWDALCRAGRTLPTPENAFGAYTMRAEFTALTGLGERALGPWAFNPYLLASRRPVWSLAWHLRDREYTVLCLHPFRGDFFRRDRVMPNLGFERFLTIEELGRLEKFGPYVSDRALGKAVLKELEQSGRPVFCFVITMEAHGPWLKGRLTEREIRETLTGVDLGLFDTEMRQYLCHLRHMDELFGMLCGADTGKGRRVELWAYGDHAPGIHK
jgi:phosphoglycerol transferase MdoB-like AlkP superfamily enzyme